jgi:rubredoxin
MTCPVKHTKFQPTDAQWRCPKCGADNVAKKDA